MLTSDKISPNTSPDMLKEGKQGADRPARIWAKRLAKYRQADDKRAAFELILTCMAFLAIFAATIYASHTSWWLTPPGIIGGGFFLVRLFIIQHDCGHGSMFDSRRLNSWVGRLLGIVTMTPYEYWRHSHAVHHAHSGNLDHRGIGDVPTLTVSEYKARNWFGRISYRVVRHPLALFGIGPSLVFIVQ